MTLYKFYAAMDDAWRGHRQTLLDYLTTGVASKPCSAGFNTLFVRHNGDVFSCPLIEKPLGNIQQAPVAALRRGAQARGFRQQIGSFPECKSCTEPGLERLAWPFEGLTCLCRLITMGHAKFDQLATHMGLSKYL